MTQANTVPMPSPRARSRAVEAMRVTGGSDIVRPHAAPAGALHLREGWAFAYKGLADGRRQVVGVFAPGDVIASDYGAGTRGVAARTDVVVEPTADPAEVARAGAAHTRRTFEMLVCLGRRTAYERMAWFIAELFHRTRGRGAASGTSFDMPLPSELLGDALGLSVVHVSRTLRKLRRDSIVTVDFAAHRVHIHDLEALHAIAEWEPEEVDPDADLAQPQSLAAGSC